MKLIDLNIRLQPEWSKEAGLYTGKATFKDHNGSEISLVFDSATSDRILTVLSEELVFTSRRVATELTANCLSNNIENPAITETIKKLDLDLPL